MLGLFLLDFMLMVDGFCFLLTLIAFRMKLSWSDCLNGGTDQLFGFLDDLDGFWKLLSFMWC